MRTARWTDVVTWLLLIWVLVAGVAAAQPDRVVAIGDIHGAVEQFRLLLETVGLTDSSQRWTGGRTTLVQTGDFMDRGAGVKAVLDLLMRLETEASAAGGRVVVLLGNHETMNLMANTRDTTPALLASFATPGSENLRAEAYGAYVALLADRAAVLGPLAQDPLPRAEWMAAHPPGFVEYMDALGPDGTYGRWLRAKPVVARVGDSILLHGGLDLTREPTDLDEINAGARRERETYDRYREQLVERGIILPFFTFQETTTAVQQELDYWVELVTFTGPPAPDDDVLLIRDRPRAHQHDGRDGQHAFLDGYRRERASVVPRLRPVGGGRRAAPGAVVDDTIRRDPYRRRTHHPAHPADHTAIRRPGVPHRYRHAHRALLRPGVGARDRRQPGDRGLSGPARNARRHTSTVTHTEDGGTGACVNGERRWMTRSCLAVACLLLAVSVGPVLAQSAEPITYTLRFPAPHTHYVSVEASVPTGGPARRSS